MAAWRKAHPWVGLALAGLLVGCASTAHPKPAVSLASRSSDVAQKARGPSRAEPASPTENPPPGTSASPVSRVSYESPDAAADPSPDPCDPFSGQAELSADQLVAEVQRRNPSLQSAAAAWRAAAQRYPQMISLDDPMFGFMIGPHGLGRDDNGGWMVEASQKVTWQGKRALRGCAAAAEADAMRGEIGDTRLQLTAAAKTALLDYYLARRQAEVNSTTAGLLNQFRAIAKTKYEVNQATEQDVLQADVELANLENRRTELARDEQLAIARINTLLHLEANHRLPLPPAQVPLPESLPSVQMLQETAQRARPDLYSQAARVRAEQANLELACKEYWPDPEFAVKYDAFMPEDMRPQVGMNFNVPLQRTRRSAAVREASERLQQRRAEYQNRLDQVQFEVQSAYHRANQGRQAVGLYREKILPAAQRNLESAQANYTAGKIDFLRLIDAQRQLYAQRDMYYQTLAEYHRRLAELERAVGESLP